MRRPSIADEIVGFGADARIALLRRDRTCILKYCFPDKEESVKSLEQEKKVLAILGPHQFITHLHSVSERGLIFEYYPLGSIRSYYEKLNGLLPPLYDRFCWCRQAVEGIAYIHSKGILHNDISTRNILMSSDMNIKICDFGFSTINGEPTSGLAETRYNRYRDWEETKPSVLDDLFAIGSLFYEILTGKRPYDDVDSMTVEQQYQDGMFPDLNGMDFHHARIINNCWNEKYSSIKEVQIDLPPLALPPSLKDTR